MVFQFLIHFYKSILLLRMHNNAKVDLGEPINPLLSRLDNVMKQINRLNNIITLDDKFNHLYIKQVLEDSISSTSYKEEQTDPILESFKQVDLVQRKKNQKINPKINQQDKKLVKKVKVSDSTINGVKPKKKKGLQLYSQRIRTKTEQKAQIPSKAQIKTRSSIKSPQQYANINKLSIVTKQKKKNTSRGINTSSHSQQSMSNPKKTFRRVPSAKWINKKIELDPGLIQKSQRGIKLNKMNLNKYKQTVRKTNIAKDLNGLDEKYHLNLNQSKSYMQRLIQKLQNQQIYQQQTAKYLSTVSYLNCSTIFKQLDEDFDTNSDLLKTLMIFISQFSEKVTKQLSDAFTKSNMKFDTLVKNTVKLTLQLPSLLYKRNEVSEVKFRDFMKQTDQLIDFTTNNSMLISCLIAMKQYLQFLSKNSLIEITQRFEVYRASKDIDYYSQRNQTNLLDKIQSPRHIENKKCQTQRKPVVGKQNNVCQFNETKKASNKPNKTKNKKSFEALPKHHLF